ncbi:uncharacterized protein A1O9_05205 [Exophiala aquamarina CBS 119918]|uniref:Uncharacterized protein n=1 Tax=Exophiala aquamarina CBS 119918 TaxID=1182545 RepID=A0A072PDE5_9EURO|nr:uncharacterized protein A1O9_05205 [Exophiala aquamarina CBS 119918]KEF57288.1 hypothetical protein A1O9_05205 [Exophiala aquamarina CBS 119918]
MSPNHRYNLVTDRDNEEVKDELHDETPPARTPWLKYLFFLLLAFSTAFGATFGVVVANSYLQSSNSVASSATPSPTLTSELALPPTTSVDDQEDGTDNDPAELLGKILDCGHSFEEARAKGCVYDVMMQDWVPEPCYDPVLTERYLAEGNYTWYKDGDGTVMSDEEMRKGEHGDAWMTGNYHKAHCIFSWEKLIRALRNNKGISQELLSYDHVLHCEMQTLGGEMHKKRDDGGIGVRAPTNYAKCALYKTWKTDFIPDKHSSIE